MKLKEIIMELERFFNVLQEGIEPFFTGFQI